MLHLPRKSSEDNKKHAKMPKHLTMQFACKYRQSTDRESAASGVLHFWVLSVLLLSSPNHAMQVCDAMCSCNPRCESRDFRGLDGSQFKQAISEVRCVSLKITFAMHFIAICALAAEIHCDVGHDAGIIASAMPRCCEFSSALGGCAQQFICKIYMYGPCNVSSVFVVTCVAGCTPCKIHPSHKCELERFAFVPLSQVRIGEVCFRGGFAWLQILMSETCQEHPRPNVQGKNMNAKMADYGPKIGSKTKR